MLIVVPYIIYISILVNIVPGTSSTKYSYVSIRLGEQQSISIVTQQE